MVSTCSVGGLCCGRESSRAGTAKHRPTPSAWWAGTAPENRALVLRRGGEAVRQLDVYGGPPSYRLYVKSLCTIC